MKTILFLLFSVIISATYGQNIYNYNLYINGTTGFGIGLQNTEGSFNATQLNYTGSATGKASAYIRLKNIMGLHVSLQVSDHYFLYSPEYDNSNYYLVNSIKEYGNSKVSVFVGVAHKYIFNRVVITPYIDFGFIPESLSWNSNYLLKERLSNNITYVKISPRSKYGKLDFTFGSDFYLHIGKHWGLAANISYDRSRTNTEFITTSTDSYGQVSTTMDALDFKHKNVFVSFGGFLSFWKVRVEGDGSFQLKP